MTDQTTARRIEAALIGAFVADAAALGFHWLYDPDRIAALAADGPEFRPPDAADFDGYKGVFVHAGKQPGDLSHYGVQMDVALQTLIAGDGRFDMADYQDRFAATFGPGGSWTGYIDKATKGTLANLAAGQRDPSGANDDQVPAIAKLPVVVAARGADAALVHQAVRATNANDVAMAWAEPAAALVRAAYGGASVAAAVDAAIGAAAPEIAAALRAARETPEADSTVFAGTAGRACPLPQAMPVIIHIAARSETYVEAVRRNIRAGGDSCGRAPVLGALFGAVCGLGSGGIPLGWAGRLTQFPAISKDCEAAAALCT